MRVDNDKRDQVIYRGPVSGTGEALSDEDAIKILDERVDPPQAEIPAIGVVVDSEQAPLHDTSPHQGSLVAGKEGHESASHALTWMAHASEDWWSMRRLFGQEVPMRIVKVEGLQAPVRGVLCRSCGFSDQDVLGSIEFDAPIILRILARGAIYDLTLSPEDCRSPNLTLLELLKDKFDRPHQSHFHER